MEAYLYVGNGVKVEVESIGSVFLPLGLNLVLVLDDVFYVPSMRRNLISISTLDKRGYSFTFGNEKFELSLNSRIIGDGYLSNRLYHLNVLPNHESLVVVSSGKKRALTRDTSYDLWHRRLGHISQERINRLIKENILPPLDSGAPKICIDCAKGKMTKTRKLGSTRSSELLEIIHTDISGPFDTTICGNKYFITFIDDFSRYGYLYLINDKSAAIDKFKIFKTEVELQLGKTIKIARSDRGDEYYGKYDQTDQHKGPFAKFL